MIGILQAWCEFEVITLSKSLLSYEISKSRLKSLFISYGSPWLFKIYDIMHVPHFEIKSSLNTCFWNIYILRHAVCLLV